MATTEPHERLRIARKRRYKTAREAAEALGVPYGTYTGHEAGSRGFSEDAERYARFFRVRPAWLAFDDGPMEVGQPDAPSPPQATSTEDRAVSETIVAGARISLTERPQRGGTRDLPVPGIAMGGSEEDGDVRLNGDVQYFIERPAGLIGRKKAFAVVLRNDSMVRSFYPGQPVFIDEDGLRPKIDDDVLVELYPSEDGEAGPAFIKILVSRSAHEVIVRQLNPPKEIRFPADRVKQILRVIPYPEAMGLAF